MLQSLACEERMAGHLTEAGEAVPMLFRRATTCNELLTDLELAKFRFLHCSVLGLSLFFTAAIETDRSVGIVLVWILEPKRRTPPFLPRSPI